MKAKVIKSRVKIVDGKKIPENVKAKKIALAVILSIVAIAVISSAALFLPKLFAKKSPQSGSTPKKYEFAPVKPYEDIYEDGAWLDLDRLCYFEDPSTGITVSIDAEMDGVPYGLKEPVAALVEFINAAIDGDTEKINGMFSKKYFESGGEAKVSFTPQKLYDIKFTYVSDDVLNENGAVHDTWTFWMEYKIKDNNGTFRNDMGSNASRREYVVLTMRADGIEIDALVPYRTAG